MGQIFRRIKNIVKSQLEGEQTFRNGNNFAVADEDEELKRIINELNSGKKQAKNESFRSEGRQNSDVGESEAYKILGLEKGASADDIKAAYKKRMREYHPDRVETLGDELKELAARKSKQINAAYNTLKRTRNF